MSSSPVVVVGLVTLAVICTCWPRLAEVGVVVAVAVHCGPGATPNVAALSFQVYRVPQPGLNTPIFTVYAPCTTDGERVQLTVNDFWTPAVKAVLSYTCCWAWTPLGS